MFRVGQKVVCVDNGDETGCSWAKGECPSLGSVYTVAAVSIQFNVEAIQLYERPRTDPIYKWYGAFRFRPAVDRPTDISVFKAALRSRELVS